MKNTFKMMLVAFAMFAFSANAGAMTLNLNKVAKSCCKKDGNEADKKECSKDGKKKSCCKKDGEHKAENAEAK